MWNELSVSGMGKGDYRLEMTDAKQRSALALAYLGDAVYESLVRGYLMEHSAAGPAALHRIAVSVVCADAQCSALALLEEHLTEEERALVKRGRNASKAGVPKNAAPKAYRAATALETLFGYLSMSGKSDRARELFHIAAAPQLDAAIARQAAARKQRADRTAE